eukprot:453886-Hanusia_phi.AAC.9
MPADLHEVYGGSEDSEKTSSRVKDAIRIGHCRAALPALLLPAPFSAHHPAKDPRDVAGRRRAAGRHDGGQSCAGQEAPEKEQMMREWNATLRDEMKTQGYLSCMDNDDVTVASRLCKREADDSFMRMLYGKGKEERIMGQERNTVEDLAAEETSSGEGAEC